MLLPTSRCRGPPLKAFGIHQALLLYQQVGVPRFYWELLLRHNERSHSPCIATDYSVQWQHGCSWANLHQDSSTAIPASTYKIHVDVVVLGLNFFPFVLAYEFKQRKIKIEPRIKLNPNMDINSCKLLKQLFVVNQLSSPEDKFLWS